MGQDRVHRSKKADTKHLFPYKDYQNMRLQATKVLAARALLKMCPEK
jgi:hypothetical protein